MENYVKIGNRIGRGTFGDAWIVHSKVENTDYVLKEISVANIEQSARERLVKFVKDEIKALNTCDHDNVVRYICDFYKDQQFQIIMEYCKNGDLRLAIMNQKRSGCHFDVEKGKSLSFLFIVMSFISCG